MTFLLTSEFSFIYVEPQYNLAVSSQDVQTAENCN